MKIRINREHWERVRKQMQLVRLKNTLTASKRTLLQNYVYHLQHPKPYPRVHIIVIGEYSKVLLEIHVDEYRHTGTHYYHPKIDKIINQIRNS